VGEPSVVGVTAAHRYRARQVEHTASLSLTLRRGDVGNASLITPPPMGEGPGVRAGQLKVGGTTDRYGGFVPKTKPPYFSFPLYVLPFPHGVGRGRG